MIHNITQDSPVPSSFSISKDINSLAGFFKENAIPKAPPSTPPPSKAELDYYEMTRRMMTPENKKILDEKFSTFNTREVKEFVNAYESGNLEVLENPDASFIALYAVKLGILSAGSCATLSQFTAIMQKGPLEAIPLFIEGKRNPEAYEILQNMSKAPRTQKNVTEYDHEISFFTEEELDHFFYLMEKKPISEQFLCIVNNPKPEYDGLKHTRETLNLNMFNHIGTYDTYPSFTMLQTALDVKFKENAVQLNPVLGLSTEADLLKNLLFNIRDIAYPFKLAPLPDTADGVKAPGPVFTYHDWYHAILSSSIPLKFKQAMGFLSFYISRMKIDIDVTNLVKSYSTIIIDMDPPEFRKDVNHHAESKPNLLFWSLLGRFWGSLFKFYSDDEFYMLMKELFIHLRLMKEEGLDFEKEFGVSISDIDDLPEYEKTLLAAEVKHINNVQPLSNTSFQKEHYSRICKGSILKLAKEGKE